MSKKVDCSLKIILLLGCTNISLNICRNGVLRIEEGRNNAQCKRYFIIDQHIARYFVHYIDSLQSTPMIFPFLTSRISANHESGLEFQLILEFLYSLMFLYSRISFLSAYSNINPDLKFILKMIKLNQILVPINFCCKDYRPVEK